jgi:hypothetical protein
MPLRATSLVLMIILSVFCHVLAFTKPESVLQAIRIDGSLLMSGKLDDASWEKARPVYLELVFSCCQK